MKPIHFFFKNNLIVHQAGGLIDNELNKR